MKLTERKSIRLTKQQVESLEILESYGVDVARFIRDSIREKLKREWKSIKEKKENVKLPF